MEIRQRENGKYRVRIWDKALGRKINVGTFRTKAEATAIGRKCEFDLASRGYVQEHKDIPLGQLCDRFLATGSQHRPTTSDWYGTGLKHARTFFGENASVRRLSREDVQRYVARLVGSGKADTTVCGYVKALGAVLEQGLEWGYCASNPAHRVRNLPTNKRRADAIQ